MGTMLSRSWLIDAEGSNARSRSAAQLWGTAQPTLGDPIQHFSEIFQGLMELHRELVAEKDRTQALTIELMGRRQEVAELQSYVVLLEKRLVEVTHPRRLPDVEGWL